MVLIIGESSIGAISTYHFISVLSLLLPCIIILFLHLLSTNHKCTQKEKMRWNSSTRSSRLHVAPIVIPVELQSLPLFCFVKSHHSL
jgi:hypothetical protein